MEEEEFVDYSKVAEEVFLKPIFWCRDEVPKHWIFLKLSHNNIEEDIDSKKITYSKSFVPPQIPNPKVDPSTMEVYVVKFVSRLCQEFLFFCGQATTYYSMFLVIYP